MSASAVEIKQDDPTSRDELHGDDVDAPGISYGIEWADMWTDELLYEKSATREELDGGTKRDTKAQNGGTVFEIIAKYSIRNANRLNKGAQGTEPPPTLSSPTRLIRIHSIAIINALQSVVEYYPGQSLAEGQLEIQWPYPILVHHYNQLTEFRDKCALQRQEDLCDREKDAAEHLGLLLAFLDREVMRQVREEEKRNAEGYYTFDYMWVSYRPGRYQLDKILGESFNWACVVHSVSGGIFENPPAAWRIRRWSLDYNDQYLGRVERSHYLERFDGQQEISTWLCFDSVSEVQHEGVRNAVECGKTWWRLLRKSCMSYQGPTLRFPFSEVHGLVMADLESYYEANPSKIPQFLDGTDCRGWVSTCLCHICRKRGPNKDQNKDSMFIEYTGDITVTDNEDLDDEDYFLCPFEIPAFVFKTRTWETLHAKDFLEPNFEEDLIDSLAMETNRVTSLKALSKSFVRQDAGGNNITEKPWSADFVKGKGNGLIFLLHGGPGVGKTCTAECIAHYTRRPLMVLTCSDIGTNPATIEEHLIRMFKTARSWGAVLLIDEADVFIEQRGPGDLERNSLVAGFLRALEFYEGILFLTTNRVGAFDDAFISRMHVQIYYPELTDDQRRRIWETFMKKLAKDRGNTMRITADVKDYIRGAEVRAAKLNGREIRNAFQTAVSMAEYSAERDEEGKVLLKDDHLRAVLELSGDFKKYIAKIHRGDENKRAQRRKERDDD